MSKPLDGGGEIADLRRGGAVFTAEDDHETDRWRPRPARSPEVIGASL